MEDGVIDGGSSDRQDSRGPGTATTATGAAGSCACSLVVLVAGGDTGGEAG
jgi:hypothetical protein